MSRSPWLRRWIVAAALAGGTAVAYAPAVGLPFVNYDDLEYVCHNPRVLNGLSADGVRWAFTTGYEVNYHPLTWVSLAIDASLSGPDPVALARTMHRTNVALHAAAVAVLFLLLAGATGADAAAAVAAAVFAVHPVHVESVAWVSERKDVLCGLFYLSAVAAHVAFARADTPGRRRAAYAGTLVLGTAALLSKPMAVTLPVALVLVDVWPLDRRVGPRRAVAEVLPLAGLAVVVACLTVAVQASAGAVQSLADRPLSARLRHVPVDYARYLLKAFWPTGLTPFYPYRPAVAAGAVAGAVAILAGTTAIAWATRRRAPSVAVGMLWFGVTLAPVIGVVQAGRQSIADRYLYLPLVGPVVAVVWATGDAVGRTAAARAAKAAAAVSVVAAATVAMRHQLSFWRDTPTLFGHALDVDPDNPVAHAQFGYLARLGGDPAAARAHYEAAVRADPGYADASYNLANLLLRTDPAAAARLYRATLAARPHDARSENNLGVALSADPARAAEAAASLRAAAADDPAWPDPHLNLGRLLLSHGRPDLAGAEFARAARLDPSSAAARRGLAEAGR